MAHLPGTALVYVRTETRTRLRALAHMDGRTLIEYLDRLARAEVDKLDTTRYNRAVEAVTAPSPEVLAQRVKSADRARRFAAVRDD